MIIPGMAAHWPHHPSNHAVDSPYLHQGLMSSQLLVPPNPNASDHVSPGSGFLQSVNLQSSMNLPVPSTSGLESSAYIPQTSMGLLHNPLGQPHTHVGQTHTQMGQTHTQMGQTHIQMGQTHTQWGPPNAPMGLPSTPLNLLNTSMDLPGTHQQPNTSMDLSSNHQLPNTSMDLPSTHQQPNAPTDLPNVGVPQQQRRQSIESASSYSFLPTRPTATGKEFLFQRLCHLVEHCLMLSFLFFFKGNSLAP